LNFSWEGIEAAQKALNRLYEKVKELEKTIKNKKIIKPESQKAKKYRRDFQKNISDDLKMPQALALMWKMIKDKKIKSEEKYFLLLDFDKVFGLGLAEVKEEKIPKNILLLVEEREKYRQQKDFQKADELREKIKKLGYRVEDTPQGPIVKILEK
jgi:cysteinyl-tRNA synthetase